MTWAEFDEDARTLAALLPADAQSLYGIPRGGLVLAVALSHHTGLPLAATPGPGCVLVDDIADSGRTLAALRDQHGPLSAVAWVKRETTAGEVTTALVVANDDWIIFPWERPERAEKDANAYASRK